MKKSILLLGMIIFSLSIASIGLADTDLVALWHFDEGTGTIAYDSSGNGNDGTLYGGLDATGWTTDCIAGNCLKFDGSNDYVQVPDSSSLNISGNELTVEFWFKPSLDLNYTTPLMQLVNKGDSYGVDINDLIGDMYNTGKMRFFVNDTQQLPFRPYRKSKISSTIEEWTANVWYYVVGTYDGIDLKLYLNGKLDNTTNYTLNINPSELPLAIGSHYSGSMKFFNGTMDEVVIYNYSKTSAEIWNDYVKYPEYISDCRELDEAGKTYILNNDVSINGICFTVIANDIILDCNGHFIDGGNGGNSYHGIYLDSRSDVTIKNCIVSNFYHGIFLYNSSNSIITNNTANFNKQYGIYLWRNSNNNTISENVAKYDGSSHFTAGILLERSSDNIVSNNIVENNFIGINVSFVNNTIISGNIANNSTYGFYVRDSFNNILVDNIAYNNSVGVCLGRLRLDRYTNNTLTRNILESNGKGLSNGDCAYCGSTNNNLIYDNYFDNTVNVYEGGINDWNITKTLGTNIIGGPYIGGNFWNDYSGTDLDEDGIGDTSYISTNIIDDLPLVVYTPDLDYDGVPNSEDKCPNTIGEQIVYGCSCEQILGLKEKGKKCSKGIIKAFTEMKGWAKNLFD